MTQCTHTDQCPACHVRKEESRWPAWIGLALDMIFLVAAAAIIIAAVLFSSAITRGAPAPMAKKPATPKPFKDSLVGKWKMFWGSGPYTVTLSANGSYTAEPGGWIGSWVGTADGMAFTESCSPNDAESWKSYRMKLCPRKLSGKVVEGAVGLEVRFERQEKKK